jgi:beta-lactamase class A
MAGVLSRQEFPVIAGVLPTGTPWGSKSGWVSGIRHDVAFVGEPTGEVLRVLAICTEGFDDAAGRKTVRRVARELLGC